MCAASMQRQRERNGKDERSGSAPNASCRPVVTVVAAPIEGRGPWEIGPRQSRQNCYRTVDQTGAVEPDSGLTRSEGRASPPSSVVS